MALLCAACSDGGAGGPVITALEPSSSPSGIATPAMVSGRDFYLDARANLNDESAPTLDDRFTAILQRPGEAPVSLAEVEWVDLGRLRITVPGDLPTGDYDLVVTGPHGTSNRLTAAFEVCADPDGDGSCGCTDVDGDGWGRAGSDQSTCARAGSDCDDGSAAINPEATDIADDGIDQDCNGADAVTCVVDGDMDGFGTATEATTVAADGSCDAADGEADNSGDCDDGTAACTTDCTDADGDSVALCAGDCDDSAATGASCSAGCPLFYADNDNDNFGDPGAPRAACVAPVGHVANAGDCDDSRTACTTDCTDADGDALALCAGDCDDSAATGAACTSGCATFFVDADGDAYGTTATTAVACSTPPGYADNALDCADSTPADPICGGMDGNFCNPVAGEGPAASASCSDGADNDCDGAVDSLDTDCWAAPECARRKRLTFDNSGQVEDLVDVPVLITLDSSRIDYGITGASGEDVRFVDADDATALAHEIEAWNSGGTSHLWVSVPRIDGGSAADFIYMYYGCASTVTQDAGGVWDPHYDGVWHLGDDVLDSTSSNHDGTNNGSTAAAGQVAGGRDFDGFNDRVEIAGTTALRGSRTVSVWAQYDSLGFGTGDNMLVSCGAVNDVEAENYQFTLNIEYDRRLHVYYEHGAGTDDDVYASTGAGISAGEWNHYAFVRDEAAREVTFYVNGVALGTTQSYATPPSGGSDTSLWIGAAQSSALLWNFNGRIDEVRVTREELSADWLRAQYLSMTDGFVSFGPAEP